MNSILNRRHHQLGVGLIEVLVALVIIAVGVIAVLGLQGTLMSGSATSKARNEALALARERTEELRNAVEIGQFDTALAVQTMTVDPDYKDGTRVDDGSGNGLLNGVNAQFTRSWQVMDVTSVNNTRELVMQVSWKDAHDAANQVELSTLITYASPMTAALSERDHSASSPGETDTGYEGLHPDTPTTGGSNVHTDADNKFPMIEKILRYSNGHVQVRIWSELCAEADKVRDSDGNEISNPDNEDEKLCVAYTAFGGALLRFNGTVYMDFKQNTLKDIQVLVKATSPAYCAQNDIEDCGSLECIEYQCYASADCANGDESGVCPTDTGELDAISALNLNGGWRGRIGHFFYDLTKHYKAPPDMKVCMSKYRDEEGVLVDNETISRSYHSLREDVDENNNKIFWREGINQPHSCHNTLFVNFAQNAGVCDGGYEEMITEGVVWNSLKDHEVIRNLASDATNNVLATDRTYCDIIAIYGSILFADNDPPVIGNVVDPGTVGYATLAPGYTDTLVSLETASYDGYEEGECAYVDNNNSIDYACNYIDTEWSGFIRATGTRTYTISTISVAADPINSIIEESEDSILVYTCSGGNDYPDTLDSPPEPNKTADRYAGEDITLNCYLP